MILEGKTAVLIDAGFYFNTDSYYQEHFKSLSIDSSKEDFKEKAKLVANRIHERALGHTKNLYRIFFYDCPPLDLIVHNPITKRAINYKKGVTYRFRSAILEELKRKRKIALRLG